MRPSVGALACVCALLSQAAAADCTMAVASRLPWQLGDGYLMVSAKLNGRPAQFIFDTGSFTSVVTEEAVRRLDLRVMKGEEFQSLHLRVTGIGGDRSALGVTARSVELGGLHARNYNFIEANVVPPPADGLLSTDLMSQFDIDLDFPERQAVLYHPTGDCSTPAAFLAGPLYTVPLLPIGQDRRPRIRVQVGDHDLVAIVDTGASRSVIFRQAAERLGVRFDKLSDDAHLLTAGVGPRRVATIAHVFEAVSVGVLTISNMKLNVLDESAGSDGVEILLGADFQSRVHLWISYSSHSLIMQYPPQASKKLE